MLYRLGESRFMGMDLVLDSNHYNKYTLLDVLSCSIAEYFYELCRILTSL